MLLKAIPCLVSSQMGDLIVSCYQQAVDSACSRLVTERNVLTATVTTKNSTLQWQHSVSPRGLGWLWTSFQELRP